jgi:hypothetical protein
MLSITDYGEDGVVPMIESEDVETVVEGILEYVETRFELLNKEGGRDADIFALVQEFNEWGTAEQGDDISYYTCPTFN